MGRLLKLLRGQLSAAPKTYAQELGWKSRWTLHGTVHTGYYRAPGLRYQGWVLEQPDGKLQFHILKPPIDLIRDTDFAGCFHARNDGWWLIAFKPYAPAVDVGGGIAAIQKSLQKAFELRASKRRSQG